MNTSRIPKIIPPRSRVRLVRVDAATPDWKDEIGRVFRIGYYRKQDGLDCIWLVNEKAEYEQTTNRKFLMRYFEIDRLSDESNFFGVNKAKLRPLKTRRR